MRNRLTGPRLLLLSFAGLILAGAMLLVLPAAAADGRSVGALDALFTSASAICVTGLVTLDTASAWSPFGKVVLLVLIQVGGLGILTLSTFVALSLGRRVSLHREELVVSPVSPLGRVGARRVVRGVILWTVSIEVMGALLLWLAWYDDMGATAALWEACFHSVSAFCNAGFSTLPDGLVPYRGDVAVNLTLMGLIVTGGLGFIVLLELEQRLRYGDRLSLHARLVLLTTLTLLVVGAVGYYVFERHGTMGGLGPGERVLASCFASVTARTAGFNTIDYGQITVPALTLTILLMLIGGSPGSCAGGIKTTTLVVLVASARSALKGHARPSILHRTIPPVAVRQAQVLAVLGLGVLLVAPFLLELTEVWSVPYSSVSTRYLELSFEAASAFGTTGLSTGITPTLTAGGKLLVIALMFCGRVGLLTLVVSVAHRRRRGYRNAEESVLVG